MEKFCRSYDPDTGDDQLAKKVGPPCSTCANLSFEDGIPVCLAGESVNVAQQALAAEAKANTLFPQVQV